MRKLLFTPIIWCLLLCQVGWANSAIDCDQLLNHSTSHQLRLMTMNTQGLRIFEKPKPDSQSQRNRKRYLQKVFDMTHSVVEINPDILVLQEVYSDYELEYINKHFLDSKFNHFLTPGNDGNGQIAFLVKKNLDFNFELRTHKDMTWDDPISGEIRPLFSRDAPVLIMKEASTGKAVMSVIGHHAKAKQDRTGDRESQVLRTRQNDEIYKIAERLQDEFGSLPVIAAGDFNANLHDDRSTATLIQKMTDVFDLLPRPPPQQRRITFSYFSKKKRVQNQLDGILVLDPTLIRIKRADVYRFRDEHGNEHPLPETRDERRKLMPTDHNPVWTDILIPAE